METKDKATLVDYLRSLADELDPPTERLRAKQAAIDSVEAMPFRCIGVKELAALECTGGYTPTFCYPPGVRRHPRETGLDNRGRYILLPGTP